MESNEGNEEPAPAEPNTPAVPVDGTTYTVKSGDCLWSIAQQFYGTGREWNVIYQANKNVVKNADELQVGMVLVIPAK